MRPVFSCSALLESCPMCPTIQGLNKTEIQIKRMRLKANFLNKKHLKNKKNTSSNTFGINTAKCPQQIKEIASFEKDLLDLVKNIKLWKIQSDCQTKLSEDVNTILKSEKTITQVDKTSNMYKLSKDEYNNLLKSATTPSYKMASSKTKDQENKEGKRILNKHEVFRRINGTSNCLLTQKDDKENILNNPTVQLLNPAKNEIGRISKSMPQI